MRLRLQLFVLLLAGLSAAQPAPSPAATNLSHDFEAGQPGEIPAGWFVPPRLAEAGYKAVLTADGCRTAGKCVIITVPEVRPPNMFGNIMRSIDATPYRGKRVVLRAAIRVQPDLRDPGSAAMWLRVDRPGRAMGLFDNMSDRPVRSTIWEFYEIRGTIDPDAESINYGVMAVGAAKAWVDDMTLEFAAPAANHPDAPAAREAIAQRYAKLDAATVSRDAALLASIARPTATFRMGTQRLTLNQMMDMTTKDQDPGAKLTSTTEITSIELEDSNHANVSVRTRMTRSKDGVESAFESTSKGAWVKDDKGWLLAEYVLGGMRPLIPRTSPELASSLAGQIAQNATPLNGVEAGKPYADLAAFGKAVGGARVVALGEATHGSREIFQMKHRLLEYLVKEKEFTVFAIEANWPESDLADRYIKSGEGDPNAALAAMYFWTWQTEEVRAMLDWMRAYNQSPANQRKLSFTSFDMQSFQVARSRVLAYLDRYAPAASAEAAKAYESLPKPNSGSRENAITADAAKAAASVTAMLDARSAELIKASSATAFRDARQMSVIVAQAAKNRAPGAGGSYRDQMMASNLEWLMKEVYPDEKVVVWAHNGHIAKGKSEFFQPMGHWLAKSLGTNYYSLGFAIHTGSVRAIVREGGRMTGLKNSPIPAAAPGTGTAVLSAAKLPLFFLNFKDQDGPLGKWLAGNHEFRECGSMWSPDAPESMVRQEKLAESYDGLVFLEKTEAARGLELSKR